MAEKKEKPATVKKSSNKNQLIALLGQLTLQDASVEQLQKAMDLRISLIGTKIKRVRKKKGEATPAAAPGASSDSVTV